MAVHCECVPVAPLAGAWIEIPERKGKKLLRGTSLPSRERGLKSMKGCVYCVPGKVAPLAGAWIEIGIIQSPLIGAHVAPLAGAWIEMSVVGSECSQSLHVAPLAGAWIEITR